MQGALREEKAIPMPTTDGLLLAHHEERNSRICEEMPHLPSIGQPDSHSPVEFTQHGYPMAFPHMGA